MEQPLSPHPKLAVINKLLLAAGALLLGVVLFYFYSHNPEEGGAFLPCPLRATTGLLCPGCGSQRAVHYLLHGAFTKAWHYNELLPLYAVYGGLLLLFSHSKGLQRRFPGMRRWLSSKPIVLSFLGVIALHFVWRNFLR